MKRSLRAFAVMTLLLAAFSSCKKDNKNGSSNSFTYDSKTYETPSGQYITYGSMSQLVLASTEISSTQGYSGTISYVYFSFQNKGIAEGTYTFNNDDDFDAGKNFSQAQAGLNLVIKDGETTGGTGLNNISAGTVTITKDGSNYSITYSITFSDGTGTFTGKYNGTIKSTVNNPD